MINTKQKARRKDSGCDRQLEKAQAARIFDIAMYMPYKARNDGILPVTKCQQFHPRARLHKKAALCCLAVYICSTITGTDATVTWLPALHGLSLPKHDRGHPGPSAGKPFLTSSQLGSKFWKIFEAQLAEALCCAVSMHHMQPPADESEQFSDASTYVTKIARE